MLPTSLLLLHFFALSSAQLVRLAYDDERLNYQPRRCPAGTAIADCDGCEPASRLLLLPFESLARRVVAPTVLEGDLPHYTGASSSHRLRCRARGPRTALQPTRSISFTFRGDRWAVYSTLFSPPRYADVTVDGVSLVLAANTPVGRSPQPNAIAWCALVASLASTTLC